MKKIASFISPKNFIRTLLILFICVFSVSCGGKKAKNKIFSYKSCTFVGNYGIVENENGMGDLRRFAKGTPVKIIGYSKEHGTFHVTAKSYSPGWCYASDLEFKPDVIKYLTDFVADGDDIIISIIRNIKYEKLSEINDYILMLYNYPGIEQYNSDLWKYLFYHFYRNTKIHDFDALNGKDCMYLKMVDTDIIKDFVDSKELKALDFFNIPMGKNRETILIYSIRNDKPDLFEYALKNQWDLTVKDKYGKTVFDYASEKGYTDIVNAATSSKSSNHDAAYEKIIENWPEHSPEELDIKLPDPENRRIWGTDKTEIQSYDEKAREDLKFIEEKAKLDLSEITISNKLGRFVSATNQYMITDQGEKIPVGILESLEIVRMLPYKHTVLIDGKTVESPFFLVKKDDGRVGIINALTFYRFSYREAFYEQLDENDEDYDSYDWGLKFTGYKTILAKWFTAKKEHWEERDFLGDFLMIEENLEEDGSYSMTITPLSFDDLLEFSHYWEAHEDEDGCRGEISLSTELSVSLGPACFEPSEKHELYFDITREFRGIRYNPNYTDVFKINTNRYLVDGNRLKHIYTTNRY